MFLRCKREEHSQSVNVVPLTCEQKLNICKQLAVGMDYVARMQCVHRDLAARNILLTRDMHIKISSPGLAREGYANEYYRLPNKDRYIPLRWFSPELISEATSFSSRTTPVNNSGGKNDGRFPPSSPPYSVYSDTWAFAVLICEVFTLATLPLARLSDQEIILSGQKTASAAASQPPNSSTQSGGSKSSNGSQIPLRPDLPAEMPVDLGEMLVRCWCPVPQQRPSFNEISTLLCDLVS